MKLFAHILAFAALLVSRAAAECPASCSGHGTCGQYDACTCYDNYIGVDCSQRMCPHGFAWADQPLGDLNHDGSVSLTAGAHVLTQASVMKLPEVFPTDGSILRAENQEAHFYAECSGKGMCDRAAGTCSCFDGYTGSSCQRARCPNDCSGHGVCRTVKEIAAGQLTKRDQSSTGKDVSYTGVTEQFDYRMWDADMNRGCVCDAGYTGADCSLRDCRRGDDPLTWTEEYCGGESCTNQVQTMTFKASDVITDGNTGLGVHISFNYTHWDGTVYQTTPHLMYLGNAGEAHAEPISLHNYVKTGLLGLPNQIIEDVEVSCDLGGVSCANPSNSQATDHTSDFQLAVTFHKPSGLLEPLVLDVADGSAPGTAFTYTSNTYIVMETLSDSDKGNEERVTCSNRGVCDHSTGLCKCFPGYSSADCSTQNALSRGTATRVGASNQGARAPAREAPAVQEAAAQQAPENGRQLKSAPERGSAVSGVAAQEAQSEAQRKARRRQRRRKR